MNEEEIMKKREYLDDDTLFVNFTISVQTILRREWEEIEKKYARILMRYAEFERALNNAIEYEKKVKKIGEKKNGKE